MNTAERKRLFLKPQCLTQLIGANIAIIVAGRRTRKCGPIAALTAQTMPSMTGTTIIMW